MTKIKPPDGSSPLGLTPSDAPTHGAETPGASFRDLLQSPVALEKNAVSQIGAAAAQATPAPEALAQAVRGGLITGEQAVERLVERALAAVAGTLSHSQQVELRAALAEALHMDPVLRELRDAIG